MIFPPPGFNLLIIQANGHHSLTQARRGERRLKPAATQKPFAGGIKLKRGAAIFETIVLATDLSPAWNEIVSCGREWRGLGVRRVILTHVLTPGPFAGPEADARAEAEPYLRMQQRQLEAQGLEVALETPAGLPGLSLNRVARAYDASLLVLGTHGKSRWREGVLGSFSSAALHKASYPVLLLPVRIPPDRESRHDLWRCREWLRHVLFPTDFSEIAAEALVTLELLAPRGVARVTLLHVLEVHMSELYGGHLQVAADAPEYNSLAILKARLEAAGVPQVQTRVTPGHPVPVILAALQSLDISLIVMGTQGRGFIEELFLGSVAHNVSRVAACPSLLVPWMKR